MSILFPIIPLYKTVLTKMTHTHIKLERFLLLGVVRRDHGKT